MEIEKLLLSFLEISSIQIDKNIDNIPIDGEGILKWILRGESTNITLENISNDWIKVSFSTIITKEGWGKSFTRSNPADNSMLVPIVRIKDFIKKITFSFIDAKNEDFKSSVTQHEEYQRILEKILKSSKIDIPLNIEIDNENGKVPTIVINDKFANHTITFSLPKTESLLDFIEVTANFLVKKDKSYYVKPLSYLIPLAHLQDYPLVQEIIDIKRRKYQTIDDITKNLKDISEDDKLLRILNFFDLKEKLENSNKANNSSINKLQKI